MTLGDDHKSLLDSVYDNTIVDGLNFAQTVTIIKNASGAYNTTTGAKTLTPTSFTKQALVRRYRRQEIINAEGEIKHGDIEFLVRKDSDISDLTMNDQITYKGETYRLIDIEPRSDLIDGTTYEFVCQG